MSWKQQRTRQIFSGSGACDLTVVNAQQAHALSLHKSRLFLAGKTSSQSIWVQTFVTELLSLKWCCRSVFPITHNCVSITLGFQFSHTDVGPMRHVGTNIFFERSKLSTASQKQVQKAKPRFTSQIPVRNADWIESHFRKFYPKADWLKIHVLCLALFIGFLSDSNTIVANDKRTNSFNCWLACSAHLPSRFHATETGLSGFSDRSATHHASFSFPLWFVGFDVLHNVSTVRWIIPPTTTVTNSHVSTMHQIKKNKKRRIDIIIIIIT